jgi:catechol 2,3-dioxygenase-like lactoylglutathione lyase family enzyme
MITGIHHVQITIPEGCEAQAREFYCQFLGIPEIPKPASLVSRGGLWLQVGERPLHVGTEKGVNRSATKAHVAYEVCDLASWRTKLLERGIQIQTGIPIPGYDRFEFRDPFGNRVEFIERTGTESV